MSEIEVFLQTRRLISLVLRDVTPAKYLAIPAGFDNNIAWNLGHLIVVQQQLHYHLAGLEMHVSPRQVVMYPTGSTPAGWRKAPDIDRLLAQLSALPEQLAEDVAAERFGCFQPYTTVTGVTLNTFAEALAFNAFHEGLHLGTIMSIKNLL